MVVWRPGMSHGSAGAIGSMDVADGDFLGADRCGASNPARPRSGTPRPAARPTSARPGLRHAPAWRWQRHFWSFRPPWGLDGGGTTPAAGLLEVGASGPVLGRAARSARILTR